MSDPIDTVRTLAPEVDPSAALLARVRSDLLAAITADATAIEPARRRRPATKRRWLLPAAVAALLATGATAWAVTRGGGSTNTSIECPADGSNRSWAVISATSGDPIADCGAEWRSLNGTEPPAMVAYAAPDGSVQVRLASQPAPDDATVLRPGVAVDTQIIRLSEALGDVGDGVTVEACPGEAEARDRVHEELDGLGLEGWRIEVRDGKPIGGKRPCAWAIVRGDDAVVELLGSEAWPEAQPFHDYAVDLHAELADDCLDLAGAEALARDLFAADDALPAGLQQTVHTVVEPSARCTTASVTTGGAIDVTLRGPAR